MAEVLMQLVEEWGDDSNRRLVEIAKNLLSFVQSYVDDATKLGIGNKAALDEAFALKCRQEALKIAQSAFGTRFLKIIGEALVLESNSFLGYSPPFLQLPVALSSSMTKLVRGYTGRLKSASQTYSVVKELLNATTITTDDEDPFDRRKMKRRTLKYKEGSSGEETIKAVIPHLLDLAWAFIGGDVTHALQGATKRLFLDATIDRATRRRRARGIRILGRTMLSVAAADTSSSKDEDDETCADEHMTMEEINRRIEHAIRLAMAKAS